MSRDDHIDVTESLPDGPDDPISPAEQAQAESFAALVDTMLGGDDLPPAMASDQRALVEVAGIVHASTTEVELATHKRDLLITQAISQATAKAVRASESADAPAEPDAPADKARPEGVTDLNEFRRRRQVVPWALAAVAAAAAVFFALKRPEPARAPVNQVAAVQKIDVDDVPDEHRSRPADALIGEIPRAKVDRARDRIDVIFSDRMAGYRDLHLRGGFR